jgi:formamidopyrimidine-DNA glycosylase
MPEVCEIALSAQILSHHLRGKFIYSVKAVGGRYLRNGLDSYDEIEELLPLCVKKIYSKGKFLWFALSPKSVNNKSYAYIWNTFGLTGSWSTSYPKYASVEIVYGHSPEKTQSICFADMRNFGTMKFSVDRDQLKKKLESLADDALRCELDYTELVKQKKKILDVLMSQDIWCSGLGNYLTAEILYHAGISPHQNCSKMNDDQLSQLKYSIEYITKLAYLDNHTGYMKNFEGQQNLIKKQKYHPQIKITKGDTFHFQVYGRKTDEQGNEVKNEKIHGDRTCYWAPKVQKEVK